MPSTSWLARELGLRFMARRKAASAMALATIALALAVNSTALSLVRAFLSSSFGLPEPDRVGIVAPVQDLPGRGEVVFADAYPNYLLLRDAQRSFDELAATTQAVSSWGADGEARTLRSARVTASFFAAVGVEPQLGRVFSSAEEGPSPAPVVIVSHALWQEALGGAPDALGRTMVLDGAAHTVVGVMPPGFAHPLPTDVWLPFDIPVAARTSITGARTLTVYGHLRAGVARADADADMEALTRAALDANAQNDGYRYELVTVGQLLLPKADRTVVSVQLGAVALILLAIVNLASLLIAWGHDRRQELAVRLSLGAGGARIVAMLILQSVTLVGAGALGGLGLALLAVRALRAMDVSPQLAIYLERVSVDGSVLAWSAGAAAVAGLLAGVLPAVLARRGAVGESLRSGRGSGHTRAALRWQRAMVLGQAALTVPILSTAALIGISFRNLARVPDGFAVSGQVVARVYLTPAEYQSAAARAGFAERLETALASEPELARVGFTSTLPIGDQRNGGRFLVELPDGTLAPDALLLHIRRVSDGYFGALALPLVQGRTFDARDGASSPPVAVVSRALAQRLWPGESPIGRQLHRVLPGNPEPQLVEVVGVVADAMDAGYQAPPGETVYVPWAQNPAARMSIVALPRTSPGPALAALRRAVRAVDPALAAGDVTDLASLVGTENALARLQTMLLSAFGLVAIAIMALGSYGLMSQLVASREREFAVRVAVGARAPQIGTSVIAQAARISGLGVAVGLAAAWLLGAAVAPFLFGVQGRSLAVIGSVGCATLALAALAALPAARRAMRVRIGAALGGA